MPAQSKSEPSIALFRGLTESQKNSLLSNSKKITLKAGDPIFYHGDPVTHFYILLKGAIQLYRESPDGQEKTLDILVPEQALCAGEIMEPCCTYKANAKAVSDSVILEFPIALIKDAVKKINHFALNLLSIISQQAYQAEIEAEHQAKMSSTQLVACFLQRLCILYDFNPQGFELPYSKTLIASRLGMELETFSRTLNKLHKHGIEVKGTNVSIYNLPKTEHYVCHTCSVAEECPTYKQIEYKQNFTKNIR